ncbi:MAG TPA: tetratricopeptide repeat protein [Candidatus Bathyarchaeia archaeon]|nr:tetratricopeptide repeat protein [Candidatus Bathyarchaeia archaeon]
MKAIKAKRKGSITVCMIVRDEEALIGNALGSVKDLADEMIVVDTGSRDGTVLEAARLGAKVFETSWNNDFSEARNVALGKATREWILVLDADEEIARADHERIRALVADEPDAAFSFEQRTYTNVSTLPGLEPAEARDAMTRGCPAYFSDRQIRLFRNSRGIRYACEIHESVEESLIEIDAPVRESGVAIHHYGRLGQSNRVYRKTVAWCALDGDCANGLPGNPTYLFEMAAQLLDLGRSDAAISHADLALELGAEQWHFHNIVGLAHLRNGNRREALSAFRAGLRLAGARHPELCNNMGVALMEMDEPAEALLHFERAIEPETDNPDILRNAASACVLVNDLEKGLEYITRSLTLDPFAAHSHTIHADIRYRMSDTTGAARILETMRFLPDTPFKVYLKAIQLYTRMHLLEEADTVVRRACEAFPEREDLFYLAGKIAELRGEDERAVSLYQRVLAADPAHADVLNCLGCIHDRHERLDDALAAFREALRLRPRDAQLEVNIGIVLDKLGAVDEADRHFANVMERGETSGFAYNALGCHLAKSNKFDEALVCFTKAIECESDNPMYYRNLGLACEKMNLHDRAAEVYEKMAAVDHRMEAFVRERLMRLRSPVA